MRRFYIMQTKEEKKEYNRLYRLRNKEKTKCDSKKYYSENKEIIKEKTITRYYNTKKECSNRMKTYRERNSEKVKKMQKEWYLNNPEKIKKQKLKRTYGITLEQYNEMFEIQGGRCIICGTHQDELKHALSVDHCHETKKIRGLLCNKCNRGIGFLNDDITLLEQAINYLKNNL